MENINIKRAALYLRFSDVKQMGGTSIEVQEKSCQNACEFEGFKVVETVRNEAVSADHTKRTGRVAALLDFCKKRQGKIDVLMVYKLDRFARGQEEHHWLRGKLLRMGILLRSATEKIDESPSGKLVEGMLAAVNEYDNEIRRERTKSGLWMRVEQGFWPWIPPVGYMPDKARPASVKLSAHIFDPACKEVIKYVFVQYSTGVVSITQLANELSKRDVRNYKNQRVRLSKQTIDNILRNPYYVGLLKHKDGRLLQGKHSPLVEPSIFNKCRDVREGRSARNGPKRNRDNPEFPLRRFVRCGECDLPLTGAPAKKKTYFHYFCRNPVCRLFRKTIRKTDLEMGFAHYLSMVKPTEETWAKFEKVFLKRYCEREQEIRGEYLQKVQQVAKLEADREWTVKQGREGVIPPATLKVELAKLEEDIELAKLELRELHGEELDVSALLAYAADFFRTVENVWWDASSSTRLKLQRLIFPEGVSYKNNTFSNSKISVLFALNEDFSEEKTNVVTPRGVEPRLPG